MKEVLENTAKIIADHIQTVDSSQTIDIEQATEMFQELLNYADFEILLKIAAKALVRSKDDYVLKPLVIRIDTEHHDVGAMSGTSFEILNNNFSMPQINVDYSDNSSEFAMPDYYSGAMDETTDDIEMPDCSFTGNAYYAFDYSTHHINIAGNQSSDPLKNKIMIQEGFIHSLSQFAIQEVFKNHGMPYCKNNSAQQNYVEQLCKQLENLNPKGRILSNLNKDKSVWPLQLIPLISQLILEKEEIEKIPQKQKLLHYYREIFLAACDKHLQNLANGNEPIHYKFYKPAVEITTSNDELPRQVNHKI